jgi:hypothetical protein
VKIGTKVRIKNPIYDPDAIGQIVSKDKDDFSKVYVCWYNENDITKERLYNLAEVTPLEMMKHIKEKKCLQNKN